MSQNYSRKMTFTLKEDDKRTVRILFGFRIFLWCVALGGFIYWAYWSFELYHQGIMDEHEYATILRPILARGVAITVVAVVVSFILRRVSDGIKRRAEIEDMKAREAAE